MAEEGQFTVTMVGRRPTLKTLVSFIISKVLLKETSQGNRRQSTYACTISHPWLGCPPSELSACKSAPAYDGVGDFHQTHASHPSTLDTMKSKPSLAHGWSSLCVHAALRHVHSHLLHTVSRK